MRDLNELIVEGDIVEARAGNSAAAKEILQMFVDAVQDRTQAIGQPHLTPAGLACPIEWPYMVYLADCFRKILKAQQDRDQGEIDDPTYLATVAKALNLRSGVVGRKEGREEVFRRSVDFNSAVMRLRKSKKKMPLSKALTEVGKRPEFAQRSGKKGQPYSVHTLMSYWKDKDAHLAAELLIRLEEGERQ